MDKLKDHCYAKTGVHFYPGTLNLELDQPYSIGKKVIRLEKEEYGGAVSVNIVASIVLERSYFGPTTTRVGMGITPRLSWK